MKRYHGTDKDSAEQIMRNNINVRQGGGELGQGFYVGNLAHQAFAWAYRKGRRFGRGYGVIQFNIDDRAFYRLQRLYLTRHQAARERLQMHNRGIQRTYIFGVDAIIAPVVGGRYIPNFTQIKFEGDIGKVFINSCGRVLL
ncbi:MAG: hypothetical protein IJZ49_00060 [Alistipes sp.]|nr:hypothetical protein [Alistipes sp.]